MTLKRYEIEVEVTRLYTIHVLADSLEEAAAKASREYTADAVEDQGEATDFEVNVVGVSRQVKRKMYQP